MSTAPRFSLRAAVTDSVSTGRRDEMPAAIEPEPVEPVQQSTPQRVTKNTKEAKTSRPATRQGARGITVWVEPEIYRMIKLVGLDADMTTQDVMMEAINDLLAKKGKGRIAKTR
ncbi:ribbon-helix-helix domain-containing protein [Methylorubrum thiocyanatum]|uniref:ribbon-helix-helix domain-containing protein n=1 Tax=Methylorubrum thiocyanatum TaxID=47958 RepID=UPI003F807AA9